MLIIEQLLKWCKLLPLEFRELSFFDVIKQVLVVSVESYLSIYHPLSKFPPLQAFYNYINGINTGTLVKFSRKDTPAICLTRRAVS